MNRSLLIALALFWGTIGMVYIVQVPAATRAYDFDGHREYTRIIAEQHRLPNPLEAWESHQPPLYYFLISSLAAHHTSHVFWVRCFSVVLGFGVLWMIAWLMRRCSIPPWIQAGLLAYVCTTPLFVILFTGYTNDTLFIFLSILMLLLCCQLYTQDRLRTRLGLLIVSIAALYTKYTAVFPIGATVIILTALVLTHRMALKRALPFLTIFFISGIVWSFWLIGHDYRYAGTFFPFNCEKRINHRLKLTVPPAQAILTLPGFHNGEWQDPFVHHWQPAISKTRSYTAYLLASSLFGSFEYFALPAFVPWLMFWIHISLLVFAVRYAWSHPLMKTAIALTVLGPLLYTRALFVCPFGTMMEFRYVGWIWLPVLVAAGYGMHQWIRSSPAKRNLIVGWVSLAIALHLVLGYSVVTAAGSR